MGQPLSIDVVYIWAIVSHNPHNRVRRKEKVQVTKGMSLTKVWLQISVIRWPVKFVQYLFNYNNEYLPQHDTFFRQSRQKSCQRHLKCCQSGKISPNFASHCFERSIRGIKTPCKCSLPFEICVGRLDA